MYYSSISQLLVLGTGLLSLSVVTAQQQNTTQPDNAPSNPQVQLTSPNDFCLFLPPQPGLTVAINEDNGVPFCMNPTTIPGSKPFPTDFITTSHYQNTDTYTQITGFFDRTKYNMNATDEGGQYDSHAHHKPTGASCQNFPFFVSLIEPSNNRFCIRCCQNTEDCKTGISQRGCARVISPGNYDNNGQFDSIPPQESSSGASGSATGPTSSASSSDVQPSASASPNPSDSSSDVQPSASASPNPSDSSSDVQPSASASPNPSGSSSPPPATNGTTTDNGDDTTGNDNNTATDVTKEIPNSSYSSVLNDLDTNSSSSDPNTDSNNNDQRQNIKTLNEEAKYILSQLQNPQVDLNALKTQFSTFATTNYPDASRETKKLIAITSTYQTTDQWKHLATVLQQKAPGNQ